jgi:hypothetical protein
MDSQNDSIISSPRETKGALAQNTSSEVQNCVANNTMTFSFKVEEMLLESIPQDSDLHIEVRNGKESTSFMIFNHKCPYDDLTKI